MSNVYIVSDTHFGHAKVIDLCNRPYKTLEEMEEDLILKWNNTVAKHDKVFHLGDFGFGSKERISAIVSRLHGRISLIRGNHDGHGGRWYFDCGFHEVPGYPVLYQRQFLLSHMPIFPLEDALSGEIPFRNVFGHIHNRLTIPPIGEAYACVSVENIGYKPIAFDVLVKQMASFATT